MDYSDHRKILTLCLSIPLSENGNARALMGRPQLLVLDVIQQFLAV
ncbi:MAG: hypothetical protein F6K56_12870 [Moorea sp. SIO3G5]|nr:hypothetical protein [Moorena sp. SIO3G5]